MRRPGLIDSTLALRPLRYFPMGDRLVGAGAGTVNRAGPYVNPATNGTAYPGRGSPALSRSGASMKFTSANSEYLIANGTSALIGGTGVTDDFSISAWFKTSTADRFIYSQGNSGNTTVLFELSAGPANQGITFNLRNTASTLLQVTEGAGSPSRADGRPHHVVVSRKGARLVLYFDGKLVALNTSWVPSGTYGLNRSTIGRRETAVGSYFDGTMSHLALWTRGLTMAEVQQLFIAGRHDLAPRRRSL